MVDFYYHITDCQELYSEAFISAIAAVAGYVVRHVDRDRNSVDLSICQRVDGEICPRHEELKIQLKCTYVCKPENGILKYPLKIKNYEDLRQEKLVDPRILVVVYTPDPPKSNWLIHNLDDMLLKNDAYWISLRGEPPVNSKSTKTIDLKNKFNVDSLRMIMGTIADGDYPT